MILTILGIFFLILFLIPLFWYGRINIGNATGIFLCVIAILIGVFRNKFTVLIKNIWSYGFGKFLICVTCLIIAAILVIATVETVLMVKAENTQPEESATLVVLGCKVNGNNPSRLLHRRITAAQEYLKAHPDAACVLSGGKGNDEGISEAQCMFNELVKNNINPERLFIEDKSTSTRTNLEYSLQIIKENQLNENIAIVTNNFHCYRAGKAADTLDIKHGSVPAKTDWFLLPTYYIRELYGILYEWVF